MNIPRNTLQELQRRATLAVRAVDCSLAAKAHIEDALLTADEGRLDLATRNDLRECIRTIDRTLRHAELCRQRLLRKAERTTHRAIKE